MLGDSVTAVFFVSLAQYIGTCIAFSISKPFRKSIFSNRWFLFALVICSLTTCYIVLFPSEWVRKKMQLALMPLWFRVVVLVVGLSDMVVTFYFERVIVIMLLQKLKERKARTRKKPPVKPHKVRKYPSTQPSLSQMKNQIQQTMKNNQNIRTDQILQWIKQYSPARKRKIKGV